MKAYTFIVHNSLVGCFVNRRKAKKKFYLKNEPMKNGTFHNNIAYNTKPLLKTSCLTSLNSLAKG